MAQDISQMAHDALASSIEFKRQFDKSDPSYHGGDPTPVPLGGSRVPKGMEGGPSRNSTPQLDEASLGPSFQAVTNLRNIVMKMQSEFNMLHRLTFHHDAAKTSKEGSTDGEPQQSSSFEGAPAGNSESTETPVIKVSKETTSSSCQQEAVESIFLSLQSPVKEWEAPRLDEPYLNSELRSSIGTTTAATRSSLEDILSRAEKLCKNLNSAAQTQQLVCCMRPLTQQLNRQRSALLEVLKNMKKACADYARAEENGDRKDTEDCMEVQMN